MDVAALTWGVDEDGYEFSADGTCICRRGGKLIAYSPDDVQPAPHRLFADLGFHRRELLKKKKPLAKRRQAPEFWSETFPDDRTALLAFVNRFGYLGYLGAGPDVREESVEHLLKQHEKLDAFYVFDMESPNRRAGESLAQSFNDYVERTNAQGLSWRMETAEDGSLVMQAVPRSLLSWMWLRAARDMVNKVNWHWCLHCGKPMALGDTYRHGALYCSDSCNVGHNRKLREKKGAKKS